MTELKKTTFGTDYLPMSAYECVDGVFYPSGTAPKPGSAKKKNNTTTNSTPTSPEDKAAADMFVSIGLTKNRAEETVKNAELTRTLIDCIKKVGTPPFEKSKGTTVYDLASKLQSSTWLEPHKESLLKLIGEDKLATGKQLEAAIAYLKDGGSTSDDKFAGATGIGVVITEEQVIAAAHAAIEADKEKIEKERYRTNTGILMGKVREALKWADGKMIKKAVEDELFKLLGEKTAADLDTSKKKVKKPKAPTEKKDAKKTGPAKSSHVEGAALKLHAVGENDKTAGYITTPKTKEHLSAHVKRIKGQVRTRFPPEPNGILHIGHAKAINFNFNYAKENNGICFLRYDDTNPEKEEAEFFHGIKEMVEWLGHTPYKVTHSSDYFDELYEMAVSLIKKDMAYVCHQQADELKGHETRVESPWKNRPVEESLRLFEDMKAGKIDEGKATLRLKHVMKDGKIDPVAYRIKFHHHVRTGDKWCIYPTYDYTHCLCDSIEDITHSLCTKEFENRRPSYYWLCNAVDIYCPVQWEYSRLNVGYAFVSKRKILKLIKAGCVKGWDDPRLFTLTALRRRGFPPKAINNFCALVGVTESTDTMIDPQMLESCVRDVMNTTCTRAMAVLDPLPVDLVSVPEGVGSTITIDNIPPSVVEAAGLKDVGTHTVDFCNRVYIARDDFSEEPPKGYKRLTSKQSLGLKYLGLVISVKEVVKTNGVIEKLICTAEKATPENKPKSFVQWVSSSSPTVKPLCVECRLYKRLFHSPLPEKNPQGFLADVNKDSLDTFKNALVDNTVKDATPGTGFQFERVGYFTVDPDTTPEKTVFNLTVELKGDVKKLM
eukprot:m.110946 g.110946  ORF g.110946 m.110946 type:complete len:830 (+) comp14052_c1_seq1:86-2575(+)